MAQYKKCKLEQDGVFSVLCLLLHLSFQKNVILNGRVKSSQSFIKPVILAYFGTETGIGMHHR